MYNRGEDVKGVLRYVNGVLFVEGPPVNVGENGRGTRRCANRIRALRPCGWVVMRVGMVLMLCICP